MTYLSDQMCASDSSHSPKTLVLGQSHYALAAVLKNDFFAKTVLYSLVGPHCPSTPARVILKVNRAVPFYGIPLQWIGRLLTWHETSILSRLEDISGIPRLLARHCETGFIYEYIPGWTLDQKAQIPDGFFDNLHELTKALHARSVVYVDMNKRGNIIIGDDLRPYLIDFQISLYLPGLLLSPVRNMFRNADIYHLYKHKVRLAPGQTTMAQRLVGRRRSPALALHRILTRPYHVVRRAIFHYLYSRELLQVEHGDHLSRENNPARFLR
jgi:hypothetical protein